jgi:pilus assembly protein FimV
MGDTTMLGIGGGIGVVLLTLAWLLLRRRRSVESELHENILLTPGESPTVELEQALTQTGRADAAEETSFISDFSPSDIDALQEETGEVDPAAEADVYIAYGRYQQAESLIKQSLDKDPGRPDLKLKLLEIYFTTRNLAAFAGLAEEMDKAGTPGREPHLWERVRAMGQELLPGHALFGMPERPSAPRAAASVPGVLGEEGQALPGLDLDLDSTLSEMQSELRDGTVLELSPKLKAADGSEPAAAGQARPAPKQAAASLDEESELTLDLDDLGSLEDIDLGDLGIESDTVDHPAKGSPKPTAASPPVSSRPRAKDSGPSPLSSHHLDEEEEIPSISLEELDLGLGSSDSTTQRRGGRLSGLLQESEVSDLGEEVETKLDLARAYIEMGDSDGAREILKEVIAEGTQEQRATAQGLLKEVG